MEIIKFAGDNKKTSMRRVITFFHDNFDEEVPVDLLLAKCRLQKDGKTIHFYPKMQIDIDKLLEWKQKRKNKR